MKIFSLNSNRHLAAWSAYGLSIATLVFPGTVKAMFGGSSNKDRFETLLAITLVVVGPFVAFLAVVKLVGWVLKKYFPEQKKLGTFFRYIFWLSALAIIIYFVWFW
jgi:hypothetical protein